MKMKIFYLRAGEGFLEIVFVGCVRCLFVIAFVGCVRYLVALNLLSFFFLILCREAHRSGPGM